LLATSTLDTALFARQDQVTSILLCLGLGHLKCRIFLQFKFFNHAWTIIESSLAYSLFSYETAAAVFINIIAFFIKHN
jgi:hypothetical protein